MISANLEVIWAMSVQIKAHLVLARVLHRQHKWSEALQNYKIVIDDGRIMSTNLPDADVDYLIGYSTIFYEACKQSPGG